MLELPKRLASHLSLRVQQELKRQHFALQLSRGIFRSEEPEYDRLTEWVQPGDWVLDVGANVGHYAVRLSELVGEHGRVFAFEPITESFELLAANCARLTHRNVSLFNVAASERSRLVGMALNSFESGLENYYQAQIQESSGEILVITLAIDSIGLPRRIALAKLDVEGHELQVLRGMQEILRRDQPILIVEGRDPEVQSLLEGLGYRFEQAERSPNRVFRPQTR